MLSLDRLPRPLLLMVAMIPAAGSAAPPRLAPPVVQRSAPEAETAVPTSAASPASSQPAAACGSVGTAPCPRGPMSQGSEQAYFAALAAAAGPSGGDPLLDKSLMTTMSRLMAVGRCSDAAILAASSARARLAAAARQVCAAH